MREMQKQTKKMMSHESIYKIMQWLPLLVSGLFFLKNVVAGNTTAMVTIGICLTVLVTIMVLIKVRNVSLYMREYIMSIALLFLIFVISLNSGASYSDDFSLFLAVIGLSGMYLEPQFTKLQVIVADVLLVIMYLLHPEKAESQSQYILCVVVFTLAASLFYLVIKRGRAFIEMSEERAKESEMLLASIRTMGDELQRDFAASSSKIAEGTQGLQDGSVDITRGAGDVSDNCGQVREKIKETEMQIVQLNHELQQFEETLAVNSGNVTAMKKQVGSVSEIISESGTTFRTMEEQMKEIVGIAKQINDISFKLTILSLNASVEAAHAGEFGSGFEVLAAEMRELSENSGLFSAQVSEVVKELSERVEQTSETFVDSEEALAQSERTAAELVESFGKLNSQFSVLYDNIEHQNESVNQIDNIFGNLNVRVTEMHNSSLVNQEAVEAIVKEMTVFRGNISKIVENTQTI